MPIVASIIAGAVAVAALSGLWITRRRERSRAAALPLLGDVGTPETGILTCPVCSSASFICAGSGGFVGLALGPFVFGGLTDLRSEVIVCVVCRTQYRSGQPTRQGAAP